MRADKLTERMNGARTAHYSPTSRDQGNQVLGQTWFLNSIFTTLPIFWKLEIAILKDINNIIMSRRTASRGEKLFGCSHNCEKCTERDWKPCPGTNLHKCNRYRIVLISLWNHFNLCNWIGGLIMLVGQKDIDVAWGNVLVLVFLVLLTLMNLKVTRKQINHHIWPNRQNPPSRHCLLLKLLKVMIKLLVQSNLISLQWKVLNQSK